MKRIVLTIMIILVAFTVANAEQKHSEQWYQNKWCDEQNGQVELVLPDGTRCDCLTATHAIEFDFGRKWSEAIGQSLYYAIQTGKKAGVVLILEDIADYKYFVRLNTTIDHFDLLIDTWLINNY